MIRFYRTADDGEPFSFIFTYNGTTPIDPSLPVEIPLTIGYSKHRTDAGIEDRKNIRGDQIILTYHFWGINYAQLNEIRSTLWGTYLGYGSKWFRVEDTRPEFSELVAGKKFYIENQPQITYSNTTMFGEITFTIIERLW